MPDRRTAGLTYLVLNQRVGDEVDIGCQLAAEKLARLPDVFVRVLAAAFEFGQDVFPAVATAGGADLPEVSVHHVPEVGPGCAELGAMEDWLAVFELLENAEEGRVSRQGGFHLVCPQRNGYRITLPGTIGRGESLSNCMVKANIRV